MDEPFTGVAADCVADSGAGIVRAAMSRPAIGRTSDGRTTELPAPLPSGLNLTVLVAGDGENYPQRSQSVAVHYDAFLSDGTAWDSSRKRQKPLRFRVGTDGTVGGREGWTIDDVRVESCVGEDIFADGFESPPPR